MLVLDEPTASLDAHETALLFQIVRDLKTRGIAIVFITHFIDQVYQIADRISVLRNGRLVGSAPIGDMPPLKLISLMIGRELEQTGAAPRRRARRRSDAPVMLEAEGLGRRLTSWQPFDLKLRGGEVVGLAGLLGSGRTETAKLVFGAMKPDCGQASGRRRADDRAFAEPLDPRSASASVPRTARPRASFGELSVRENIVLALQSKRGWLRRLPRSEQDKLADRDDQDPGDQHARRREAGRTAFRRQPAEGHSGALAGLRPARAHPRRADARHRRRRPRRNRDADPQAVRRRGWRCWSPPPNSTSWSRSAIGSRCCATASKIGEISGADITRDNVIQTIAGTQS